MMPPPVAVTVRVQVPTAVPEATVTVSTLEPLPGDAMAVDENFVVTPLGAALIDKASADLNPFTAEVVRVIVFDPPAATLRLEAFEVSVKVGVNTVRLSVWVLVIPPPVAVTTRV